MKNNQRAASDVIGPAILELLGLPLSSEKVVITLEGGKPIQVECRAHTNESGDRLETILREYGVTKLTP